MTNTRFKRNELISLLRECCRLFREADSADYIAEQVKLWSNSEERLDLAIACFKRVKQQGMEYAENKLKEWENLSTFPKLFKKDTLNAASPTKKME